MSRGKKRNEGFCTFCGKSDEQVRHLIRGPGEICICDECVEICNQILRVEKKHPRSRRQAPKPEAPLASPLEGKGARGQAAASPPERLRSLLRGKRVALSIHRGVMEPAFPYSEKKWLLARDRARVSPTKERLHWALSSLRVIADRAVPVKMPFLRPRIPHPDSP